MKPLHGNLTTSFWLGSSIFRFSAAGAVGDGFHPKPFPTFKFRKRYGNPSEPSGEFAFEMWK
jgi:hypothetical protein